MPVFNRERFVESAVTSILQQTFADFELIVVDDGSQDGSPTVLRQLAKYDSRIALIHQENQGVVQSRNRAICMARGKYVALMDSDDISHPNRLTAQKTYLDAHCTVAAVGGGIRVIDECGKVNAILSYPTNPDSVRELLFYGGSSAFAFPTMMFRAEVLRELRGYRYAFAKGGVEDLDLMLRLAERHNVGNLEDIILDYRIHGNQLSLLDVRDAAIAVLAARRSHTLRHAGLPDPIDESAPIAQQDLTILGILDDEIADTTIEMMLVRAREAADARLYEVCDELLRQINSRLALLPHRPRSTFELAWMKARLSWQLGRRWKSALAICILATQSPLLASRRVLGVVKRVFEENERSTPNAGMLSNSSSISEPDIARLSEKQRRT